MSDRAELVDRGCAAFRARFGEAPDVLAWAPGRVELLGNHTDYNGGLVASAAIDRWTVVVGRSRADTTCRVEAVDLGQVDTFDCEHITATEPGAWSRYVRGVCWAMAERFGGMRRGFDAAIVGNVPLGAGLSSSASLQAAVGMLLIGSGVVAREGDLAGFGGGDPRDDDDARMAIAHALRRSENEFVGVGSGLLDQFSALCGVEGGALWLDCRSLAHGSVTLGEPAPAIVVCDSGTSRRLADGMYDRRVEECGRVVEYFRGRRGGRAADGLVLSDVTLEELEGAWERLDEVGRLRARHVLTENRRVREGVAALERGDVEAFGRLMSASHRSSRDDFANSSPALDALMEAAEEAPGFLGGKLSGAGWAGCTVNLVRPDQAEAFVDAVKVGYQRRVGTAASAYLCGAAAGASFAEL